jgi:hypothetical protein
LIFSIVGTGGGDGDRRRCGGGLTDSTDGVGDAGRELSGEEGGGGNGDLFRDELLGFDFFGRGCADEGGTGAGTMAPRGRSTLEEDIARVILVVLTECMNHSGA